MDFDLRVVEYLPERIRVCGRIFEIDQTLHSFWLDMRRGTAGVTWELHFDVVAASPRRERNAIDTFDDPQEIEWRITLSGAGEVQHGTLVVTATS
jgi:hypothetical protein